MAKKLIPPAKILHYLEDHQVNFRLIQHRTAYTAYDAAATLKKKLSEIAKILFVKADRDFYLAVLPADYNLQMEKLGKIISRQIGQAVKKVILPGEKIMAAALKIKAGALSAFGQIHRLPVIVEKNLAKNKRVILPTGSFNYSVEMAMADYLKLEKGCLGIFGQKKKIKAAKTLKPKKISRAKAKISLKKAVKKSR